MAQRHVLHLASDYVLDLLPEPARQQVDGHIATCDACRQAIARERQVGLGVREALQLVTRPNESRLRELMPSISGRVAGSPMARAWRPQLAAAAVVLLFIVGSLGLGLEAGRRHWSGPAATLWTSTATATDRPTQTATRINYDEAFNLAVAPGEPTAHLRPAAAPRPAVTPVPAAIVHTN